MSRRQPATWDGQSVYRITVEVLDSAGVPIVALTRNHGPYMTRTAARAQATRLAGHNRSRGDRRRAHIERADVGCWEATL